MFGKFLISASVAALLAIAPAVAQQSQDESTGGQDSQILLKKKKGQPQGENMGQAPAAQPDQTQAPDKMKGQQTTGDKLPAAQEQQATDQNNQVNKKKKIQQNTQTDQTTGQGQADQNSQQMTNDQNATTKKNKKVQQTQQGNDQMTTGATGKAANDITVEKRTIIREKIISKNVPRIDRDKVNIDINVGVVVPRTVHVYPLPPEIVEIVPAYRDYDYFVLADGTIIIVDPGTLEIVFVLAA